MAINTAAIAAKMVKPTDERGVKILQNMNDGFCKAVVAHKLDTWYQTMADLDGAAEAGGQVEVRETPEAS